MPNYDRKKIKQLTIKKLGWRRVARNVQRFGWVLYNATEHTTITETTTYEGRISGDTIYINPRTNRKSYTRVWLTFYRALEVSAGVKTLEFFYNAIYILRKIFAFCQPFLWVGTLIMWITAGTGNFAAYFYGFLRWAIGCSVSWILCIILEGVLSRVAGSILKKRLNPYNEPYRLVLDPMSGGNNGILTLCDTLGRKIKYKYLESASYQGNNYIHLKELDTDSGIICKVTQDVRGKVIYDMQLNEDIVKAVVAEFKRKSQPVRSTAPAPKIAAPAASTPPANECPEPYGDDDGYITLKGKNGENIDFVEVAGICYRGNFYAILQPVELLDGMEDNEALVFRVSRNADGEDNFEVELNDEIIDAVFAEYNRLLDEADGKRTA